MSKKYLFLIILIICGFLTIGTFVKVPKTINCQLREHMYYSEEDKEIKEEIYFSIQENLEKDKFQYLELEANKTIYQIKWEQLLKKDNNFVIDKPDLKYSYLTKLNAIIFLNNTSIMYYLISNIFKIG
ncbi:hypothetical protein [Spiroplasma endosymbiont of Crioceris asparagi]|uniref:hypothetical protein n=1 Tax=Spiroplasma endosymbiont of Crioceris asparagi TaxID=3066286 RepID=UPI0030D2864A